MPTLSSNPAKPVNPQVVETSPNTGDVEVLPPPVSDEVVEATVREVNELSRQATLEISIRIGAIVIGRFNDGDLGAWRRRGTTDASFRKLAAHPDLQMSPSGLYRAVAVYELCERLVGVSGLKQLSVGHFRAVLGLQGKHQVRLLTSASEGAWTVDKLAEEVTTIRGKEGDGRGRKPDPGFVKGIRRMGKLLDEEANWFDDLDKVDSLDAEDAEALWKTVTGMKIKCEELQKRLGQRMPGFGE